MHTHATLQTSLAVGIVEQITSLDEMLKLADAEDHAELVQLIAALDPAEVQHVLAVFGVKSAPVAVEAVKG
jgi:hypothetical protein